jgi:hypothetical protein
LSRLPVHLPLSRAALKMGARDRLPTPPPGFGPLPRLRSEARRLKQQSLQSQSKPAGPVAENGIQEDVDDDNGPDYKDKAARRRRNPQVCTSFYNSCLYTKFPLFIPLLMLVIEDLCPLHRHTIPLSSCNAAVVPPCSQLFPLRSSTQRD